MKFTGEQNDFQVNFLHFNYYFKLDFLSISKYKSIIFLSILSCITCKL